MSFTDKVVLVTGASSGIGAEIAIQFAKEGAKVAIVGRNEERLQTTSEKCNKAGSKALVIVADLMKDEDVRRIVSTTLNQFGKLNILINNAGVASFGSILAENALKDYDRMISTNLRSVVHLTNLALPYLTETKGNIVNISSIAALMVLSSQQFAYSTSKAGLDHFSRCLALEVAPKGVRVNIVNPGGVNTDIIHHMNLTPEIMEKLGKLGDSVTPLRKIANVDEVANLVLFIASDKAKGLTGGSYVIDNGSTLTGPMF